MCLIGVEIWFGLKSAVWYISRFPEQRRPCPKCLKASEISTGILAHSSLKKLSDDWWSLVYILPLLSSYSIIYVLWCLKLKTEQVPLEYSTNQAQIRYILWDVCPAGNSSDHQLQFMHQRHHNVGLILQRIHYVLHAVKISTLCNSKAPS